MYADPSQIVEEVDHQAGGDRHDDDAPPFDLTAETVRDFMIGAAVGSVVTLGAVALGQLAQRLTKKTAPPRSPPPPIWWGEAFARARSDVQPQRPPAPPPATSTPPRARWEAPASSWASPPPPPPPATHLRIDEDAAAAALLGVALTADENEIRAAHKRIVRDRMNAAGFGDTAADQTETVRINAARQRLIERARKRGGTP